MSIWIGKDGRRHVGVMRAGKRIHRTLPVGATARDAKLIESQLLIAAEKAPKEARAINIPGDPTLTEVMSLYIKHAATLRSPQTAIYHALRIGPWAAKYRASQTRLAAAHFICDAKQKYADATINWSISTLKKALSLAYDAGLTPQNYADQAKTIKVSNIRTTTLTIDQLNTLAEHCSDAVKTAVFIAIYTGCRRGEIVKMRREDVRGDEIEIVAGNTKTFKTRTIPIIDKIRPWLEKLPLGITDEGLKSGFRRARDAAEMPWLHFKDLRRSCATMMIAAEVDLYVVSDLLGHSSVTVTQQRYGHLQIKRIKDGLNKTFK